MNSPSEYVAARKPSSKSFEICCEWKSRPIFIDGVVGDYRVNEEVNRDHDA